MGQGPKLEVRIRNTEIYIFCKISSRITPRNGIPPPASPPRLLHLHRRGVVYLYGSRPTSATTFTILYPRFTSTSVLAPAMGSEIEAVEQRVKSFTGQLQTECGILERLVYKHKNQHRRSSYFQYILKVRRDLKLLKLANFEEIFETSFLVINGNRPKQKIQLLESLKRRKCDDNNYNFLERLLGVIRLLSEMVEPLLKAAMEISTVLARSFFMKFSLTVLAVLARIRVLIQQILVDAVLVYNTVSSLSQKEQTVKLNQQGFEVFREYYPKKEEDSIMLECIWQTDKYVLVERPYKSETNNQEKDELEDVALNASKIQYENIEAFLGVDDSCTITAKHSSAAKAEENAQQIQLNNDEKQVSDTAGASNPNIVSSEDMLANTSVEVNFEKESKELVEDGSYLVKVKNETKKKVAFVSVKPPVQSARSEPGLPLKGVEKKENTFFNLLTGGSNNNSSIL